jgi:hypothetical protein
VAHAIDRPLVLPPSTFTNIDKLITALQGTAKISARYFRPLINTALKSNGAGTVSDDQCRLSPAERACCVQSMEGAWSTPVKPSSAVSSWGAFETQQLRIRHTTPQATPHDCPRPAPVPPTLSPPCARSSSCRWTLPGTPWAPAVPRPHGPPTTSSAPSTKTESSGTRSPRCAQRPAERLPAAAGRLHASRLRARAMDGACVHLLPQTLCALTVCQLHATSETWPWLHPPNRHPACSTITWMAPSQVRAALLLRSPAGLRACRHPGVPACVCNRRRCPVAFIGCNAGAWPPPFDTVPSQARAT